MNAQLRFCVGHFSPLRTLRPHNLCEGMHLFAGPWLALWAGTMMWVALGGPVAAMGEARDRVQAGVRDACHAASGACVLVALIAVPWGLLVMLATVLDDETSAMGACVAVYGAGAMCAYGMTTTTAASASPDDHDHSSLQDPLAFVV